MQQSSVSRAIQLLEEEYRTPLVTRSTRKMTFTEAGLTLLGESRRLIAELTELKSHLQKVREEPRGVLRIGMSTAFGKLLVVPMLHEFKSRYPEVQLEIHFDDALVDIVGEGLDVAIRVGASEDSLITSRKIAVVRRGLFVHPRLLRALGPIRRPEDLSRYPALLFQDRLPSRPQWLLAQGRSRQRVPIPTATAVNQLDALYLLLKEGLGVGYVPLFFNDPSLGGAPLERILPEWEAIQELEASSSVYALFPGGARASAKVRVFVDYLVEKLSKLK